MLLEFRSELEHPFIETTPLLSHMEESGVRLLYLGLLLFGVHRVGSGSGNTREMTITMTISAMSLALREPKLVSHFQRNTNQIVNAEA